MEPGELAMLKHLPKLLFGYAAKWPDIFLQGKKTLSNMISSPNDVVRVLYCAKVVSNIRCEECSLDLKSDYFLMALGPFKSL